LATQKSSNRHKVFALGELFSGPGGIGTGALRASATDESGKVFRLEHAWANDYDPSSCESYRANLPIDDEMVLCEPVQQFVERFPELPPIQALTFGFPCNDFSAVGETQGLDGKFGPLYEFGAQAIDFFRPDWFFAENVGGLTHANEGRAFATILDRLVDAGGGYEIVPHLYRLEDYGIPQRRHRVIIVGIRSDIGLKFRAPAPTHDQDTWVTAKEAFEMGEDVSSLPNNEPTRQHPTVVERLRLIRPGENAWSADLPPHLQLNVKGARLSNIYRRLDPDRPAYTVTGSGGGGTHMYHYAEPRALTNRERARLQSFPDDFVFLGRKEAVRKQIGMAVPPLGAEIVITAILKTFAGVPYESVDPTWDLA
jgi:DNA (cytosine-5)-methyltransferase 1